MSIRTELDRIIDEVLTQSDLLDQALTALQGKVAGTDPVLQEKTVTPSTSVQSITPDAGYDGLSKVNVGAIPDDYIVPSGTVNITENGEHDVREAEAVNVNVPAPEPVMQEKTVTPSTSVQSVTPDSGYDGLSKVTVEAMPTATQATPFISVDEEGLISASWAILSAGYVSAGAQKATQQLTTQAAQTITPGTTNKTINGGQFLTGIQTIKGDANLVAENIKSGVSIFGVAGSYEGSGEVSSVKENATVTLDIGSDVTLWEYIGVYYDNGVLQQMNNTSEQHGPTTVSFQAAVGEVFTLDITADFDLVFEVQSGIELRGRALSSHVLMFKVVSKDNATIRFWSDD